MPLSFSSLNLSEAGFSFKSFIAFKISFFIATSNDAKSFSNREVKRIDETLTWHGGKSHPHVGKHFLYAGVGFANHFFMVC
jgi:UDP-glucose 6-dehydrogenase